jgi:hypothetical protein
MCLTLDLEIIKAARNLSLISYSNCNLSASYAPRKKHNKT